MRGGLHSLLKIIIQVLHPFQGKNLIEIKTYETSRKDVSVPFEWNQPINPR